MLNLFVGQSNSSRGTTHPLLGYARNARAGAKLWEIVTNAPISLSSKGLCPKWSQQKMPPLCILSTFQAIGRACGANRPDKITPGTCHHFQNTPPKWGCVVMTIAEAAIPTKRPGVQCPPVASRGALAACCRWPTPDPRSAKQW